MLKFKCLYAFTSPEINLIEVKRLDQPEGAPLSDIYKWLVIYKDAKILELKFKSMDKNEGMELREFHEGSLEFNQAEAHFKLSNQAYQLVFVDSKKVESHLLNSIELYLK